MISQVGPAVDTAISSVAFIGQVSLKRLDHSAAVWIPHTCSGRVGLASRLPLLSTPSARHTIAPDDNANCCDLSANRHTIAIPPLFIIKPIGADSLTREHQLMMSLYDSQI